MLLVVKQSRHPLNPVNRKAIAPNDDFRFGQLEVQLRAACAPIRETFRVPHGTRYSSHKNSRKLFGWGFQHGNPHFGGQIVHQTLLDTWQP